MNTRSTLLNGTAFRLLGSRIARPEWPAKINIVLATGPSNSERADPVPKIVWLSGQSNAQGA